MHLELLLWLFGAHYIGDIALQADWMASMKGKRWYILLAHVAIWTTIVCIPLKLLGALLLWKVVFLFVGHYIADRWKSKQPKDDAHWHLIYYDQAWHLLQLVIVCVLN